jgi:hypothetical protein
LQFSDEKKGFGNRPGKSRPGEAARRVGRQKGR